MFKFVIQDNQKYLVMKVSKRLYCSRCYPILQMILMAISFVYFLGQQSLSVLAVILATILFYLMRWRVLGMILKTSDFEPVTKLSVFFPSKMEACRQCNLMLQNRLMLFHITEIGGDATYYYKPIFCFWEKGCYISKNHFTLSQALCQDKTDLTK